METLLRDIRYGIRFLFRNPTFSTVAVIVLALGIGATTAIFSVINSVLLKDLPFKDSAHLVSIYGNFTQLTKAPVSAADYLDWKMRNQSFEGMSCFAAYGAHNLSGVDRAEQLRSVFVSADLFSTLGVQPMIGRNFLRDEDKPDHFRVVLLSHSLWKRRFGSDRNLVGKTIKLEGLDYTVVGIMGPGFQFPLVGSDFPFPADIWVPLPMTPKRAEDRNTNYLSIIGRLKRGITIQKAQMEMDVIAKSLEQQYPTTNTGDRILLVPYREDVIGKSRVTLFILFGTVILVLLIACANIANLLLARAATRKKEMAIRTALGVSRGRLIRQLLTESMILSFMGGVVGLLIGTLGTRFLVLVSPENIPRLKETTLDFSVLLFTFVVSVLTGIIFGLAPALQLLKSDLNESLSEGDRGGSSGVSHAKARSSLIVIEVALALVLLISSGLMIKSFVELLLVKPGLNPSDLLTLELSLPSKKYPDTKTQDAFFKTVVERTRNLPGVESVGGTSILPLTGSSSTIFSIEGQPAPPENLLPWAGLCFVTPNYFRTMEIPLIKGRDFTDRDDENTPDVVVINEKMAKQNWPNSEPIGQRIKIRYGTGTFTREIVGIVGNIRHLGLDQDAQPEMYMPIYQYPENFMFLVARTRSNPMSLSKLIQDQVAAIDKDQPVANIKTMQNIFSSSVAPRRFSMLLITIFASLALALSAAGIYSVISYSVAQRNHELGIRMALGASSKDVLKLILGQGFKLVVIGTIIGLAGAFALTRLLQSMLFNVSTTDPIIFVAISLILISFALLASYIPARRATKVDPMIALRHQ
jgi:putative ABC transport system permease protein